MTGESDRLGPLVDSVVDAFIVEGRVPSYHRERVADLRASWPTLHDALVALVEARMEESPA